MTTLDATRDAFLADIIAHPDDDTPRLIFADWLEEHGEEARAEFVRLDVRIRLCRDANGWWVLDPDPVPQIGLLRQWVDAAKDVCDALPLPPDTKVVTCRGFIHAVTLTAQDWLAHADALLAAQPIREVRLTTWPGRSGVAPASADFLDLWVMPAEWATEGEPGECDSLANREPLVRRVLERRWPHLTFTFPPS